MACTRAPMARPVSALSPEGDPPPEPGAFKPLIVATIFVIGEGRGELDTGAEQCIYHQIGGRAAPPRQFLRHHHPPRRQPLVGGPPGVASEQARWVAITRARGRVGGRGGQDIAISPVVTRADENPPVVTLGQWWRA